jgi:hypothetical protein
MKTMRTLGMITALAISVSAFAANVTGNWRGKLSMDMKALRAQFAAKGGKMKPEQQKMIEAQMTMAENMFKTMVFDLTIKADGTYSMKSPAGPGGNGGKTETGKWKLAGNTVTMNDDKPGKGPKVITGKLSANGKTIVVDMTEIARAQAASKGAPKGTDIPAMTLTFTKS